MCYNADSTQRTPPFVVGRATHPNWFGSRTRVQLGFQHISLPKARMRRNRFFSWLSYFDERLKGASLCLLIARRASVLSKIFSSTSWSSLFHAEEYNFDITAFWRRHDSLHKNAIANAVPSVLLNWLMRFFYKLVLGWFRCGNFVDVRCLDAHSKWCYKKVKDQNKTTWLFPLVFAAPSSRSLSVFR